MSERAEGFPGGFWRAAETSKSEVTRRFLARTPKTKTARPPKNAMALRPPAAALAHRHFRNRANDSLVPAPRKDAEPLDLGLSLVAGLVLW